MPFENYIVAGIVLLAAAYLVRRVWLKRKKDCGDSCGCGAKPDLGSKNSQPLVRSVKF